MSVVCVASLCFVWVGLIWYCCLVCSVACVDCVLLFLLCVFVCVLCVFVCVCLGWCVVCVVIVLFGRCLVGFVCFVVLYVPFCSVLLFYNGMPACCVLLFGVFCFVCCSLMRFVLWLL